MYLIMVLLTLLGFKPDLSQSELDYVPLPNPFSGPHSKAIFNHFQKGETGLHSNLNITAKDRRAVSNYLNTCLNVHFEGLKNLKSLQILREMASP